MIKLTINTKASIAALCAMAPTALLVTVTPCAMADPYPCQPPPPPGVGTTGGSNPYPIGQPGFDPMTGLPVDAGVPVIVGYDPFTGAPIYAMPGPVYGGGPSDPDGPPTGGAGSVIGGGPSDPDGPPTGGAGSVIGGGPGACPPPG